MISALDMASVRAYAESLMTSTCTIRAAGSGSTFDEETGAVVPNEGDVVYSGKCRVRPAPGPAGQAAAKSAGGDVLFVFDYLVSVPFAVVDVLEKHRLHIDFSPDPSVVGRDMEIESIDRGDHLSARRLMCREVS